MRYAAAASSRGNVAAIRTRRLDIAERLRAADLGGEVSEQRELFHETEVVRRLIVGAPLRLRTLLGVELVEQRGTLRRRR